MNSENLTGKELRAYRQQLGLSQAKLSELCGVSQHILSAFELEKIALSLPLHEVVTQALANKEQIASIANRSKRYRLPQYAEVGRLTERVERAVRTKDNFQYLSLLNEIAAKHQQDWRADSIKPLFWMWWI